MRTIYSDDVAQIDAVRAVFNGDTLPIRNITGVGVREQPGSNPYVAIAIKSVAYLFFGGLGFFFAARGFHLWRIEGHSREVGHFSIAAALCFAGALATLLRQSRPTRYALVVSTSGPERVALSSTDRAYIQRIRAALETALEEASGLKPATPTPPAQASWPWKRIVALDVETTGLSKEDRIVSIGLVLLEAGGEAGPRLAAYHAICNPGRRSHPRAETVHGYAEWALSHQQEFSEFGPEIARLLAGAELIVAHNADFDMRFVEREFALMGLPKMEFPVFCTMQACRELGLSPASLAAVSGRLGLARDSERHGALEDAWLALEIFLWLKSAPFAIAPFADLRRRPPSNYREPPPRE